MNDLDTELRAMLRERAGDIDTLPAYFTDLESVEVLDTSRRHTAWLVAAAVAAVLAIVGALFAIRPGSTHRAPATTHSPSVTHTSTAPVPPPKTGHANRKISLSWFGMKALPGYALHARESDPGYRWLAVRNTGDIAQPEGCNGCESASDYIYVFDKGAFDAAKYGVTSWSPVRVSDTLGYIGLMPEYGASRYEVRTVAWQYASGAWTLVQGVTPSGSSNSALLEVANAVEPTVAVPITLPFALSYVPNLAITQVMDDRSEGYSFTMQFGEVMGRNMNVTIWPTPRFTNYDTTSATPVLVDGQHGYYDAGQGLGVSYNGQFINIGFGEGNNPPAAADDRQLRDVMAGLHWAPGTPAERAIP